jgi:hypothetical protein
MMTDHAIDARLDIDLSDERAAFRDLIQRIATYRHSGTEPPIALVVRSQELLCHFAAVSQGR